MSYDSYHDIRGDEAKDISVAMGIDEESGIQNTGYLVELRTAKGHFKISAHAPTYAREVKVDSDRVKKEAIHRIYSPTGSIETLKAGWSYEENGYHGPLVRQSFVEGQNEECQKQWEKYESLIARAEVKSAAQKNRLGL